MRINLLMNKSVRKAAILVCLIAAFMAMCLTGCGEQAVQNEGTVTLGADATQKQLMDKLSDANVTQIVLDGNITLTEPVQITGTKTVSGNGTVTAGEDFAGDYLIVVPADAKLTLSGNVVVDAAGIAGGVHTAANGVLTVQEQASVKNASVDHANVLVEGYLDLLGGSVSSAGGHNIHNKGETNVVGGSVQGSGSGFAGIYNEGTLSQNGGSVTGAYNNIVSAEGSQFTWNDGTNENAVNNGIVAAPNAKLNVTARSAKLTGAGNYGIELQGSAVIDDIALSGCFNTQIRVASTGELTLNGGMIFNGSYHGVDNDGIMTMNGGDIMACADCGIVNTGVLEVKGGGISDNGNKGILNKLEGKATVVSEDVVISGNRFAIGNDDKAYFELAKANLMMSTTTNIYALDGEMYIHDIELGASSSNNIRVVAADLTLKNVQINGNASTGSQSMHGIILEGGTVTATDLTVRNTTGAGIRNKGGVFTGTNVTLTRNNYIGIYTSDQDVTGRPGTTVLTNLTVSEQGYMSISSNGTGVMEITNAVFEATPSNNIRVNGGTLKLNKVEVKGHTDQATTSHHGVYLEGGQIIANDLTISNTTGHGLRNKSGDFTGTNVTIKNVNGDAGVSNVMLADGTSGTVTLNNVSFINVKSKNIVSEAGTTIVNGSYLAPAPGSNIKITGGAVSLNDVTVAGNVPGMNGTYHAVILENGYGALYMNNVTICDAKDSGIRNKTGVVKGENITIKDCGGCAISNGQDTNRGLKGKVEIDGLTVENCGTNNIVADAGEVHISNAKLAASKSNSVKTSGTALITLTNTEVNGSTGSYGVIAEGGTIELNDVVIRDTKTAGIRVNKPDASVTGKNVTIENTGTHGLYVDKGSVTIEGLTTRNIGERNIQVGANENKTDGIPANGGTVTIIGGELCKTEKQHSVVAYGENQGTLVELVDVVLNGSGNGGGSRHVLLAEGGNMKLTNVTVKDANNAALRVNKAASTVEAENLTIIGGTNGVSASAGTVTIKGLTASASNRNIAAEGATITVEGGTLGTTSTHNIKINKGKLNLKDVTMEGSSGRGIMIEPGASDGQPVVNLENVKLSNIKSNALENRGGIVTAKGLTITDSKANGIQNQRHKDGKTAGSVDVTDYICSGIARSINNDAGTVTVIGGNFGSTNGHNVKASSGTVSLTNVTIEGTTSNSGVMAEGGNVNLTDVTIKNTAGSGVRVNKAASTVTATNLTVQGAKDGGIFASAGTVNVSTYIASGNNRNIDVSGATVTVSNASLGATTTHNVKTSKGTLELTNATIGGSSTYGMICEGGTLTARDVTVQNTSGSAVRVNNENGVLTAVNLTVEGCSNAISADAGSVFVDTMTANTTGATILSQGAVITLKNAKLTNGSSANLVEHSGGTLNLVNADLDTVGEGFYQVYNTAENLKISDRFVGTIFNDEPVAVNVENVLSADSAILIDWAEGKAPSGTAIAFAEGVVDAVKGQITLGPVQSQLKELVYTGNTGVLENLADYVAQVNDKKFESLEEALEEMNKLTGDVTLTILADCATAEPIVVPAGMNLTVQGGETAVGLNATVVVSQGATLTIGENVNISKVDATAGGSIVYAGNTATAESPLTVIVKGEPHEVAVTLAENSTATADMFRLVDTQGIVYGSLLEEGKIKVYTKDVTDTASLQAAIADAPVNAKGFIILKSNITLNSAITINSGIDLTVLDDGSQRSIVRDNTVDTFVFITVNQGGKLTMTGSSNENRILLDAQKKNNLFTVNGGNVVLNNVDLKNAGTGGSSLVNFLGGSFTATNGDFSVAKHAVYTPAGLTASDVVTLTNVNISNTGSNGIVAASGIVNLNGTTNITAPGTTGSHHGIYIDGGTVNSTGTLNITANSKGCAVRFSTKTTGVFTGETVNLSASGNYAVNMDAGSFTVTKGGSICGTRSFQLGVNGDANSAAVNLTGVTLKLNKSGQNNIKAARGTITLTDVIFEGAGNHGVILEGGTPKLIMTNVTMNSITGSAIRNKTGVVEGTNVTINGAAIGLYNESAACVIDIDGLTITNAAVDTQIQKGSVTLANFDSDVTVIDGSLSISGKAVSSITINNASALNVPAAITAGSAVTVDWAEGKAPADTAISFASADAMAASREYITLGAVQTAANKALKYADAKAVLVDIALVTTAEELTNALAAATDFVSVKLAANTEFAVESLNVGAKEVVITGQEGAVIKYSGSTKNANLLNVSSGGNLKLDGVTLDCNSVGKIMIEAGETVTMKNCTVQNANGCTDRSVDTNGGNLVIEGTLNLTNMNWALCAQNGGQITSKPGSKVIINTAKYGVVLHGASSIYLNSLEVAGVANNPVYVDDANGVVVIDNSVITGGKNAVHLLKGSLTLNNANISGATTYGIYLKNTTAKLYGTNIHIEATGNSPINADNGIIDISNFSTANLKSSHSLKATGASNVTVNGLNLGVSNSNAIRLDKTATVTLKGTCVINGTKSNHGIAFGAGQTVNISGDFTTQNIAGNGICSWGGTLNISGKLNTGICFDTTGNRTLNITGALAAGSNLVVDWTAASTPDGTAIQFASAADLNASKGYITLGAVQAANYELSYGETTATLIAKASASSTELEVEPTQEQ